MRAGGEHFSSGGEIRGFLDASPEHVSRLAWNIAAPARCRKPVIAASRGYCFGVGFELALACDFRLVSETCLYSLPEQRLGQIPGSGGAARLQKMVGITRAKDIVMRSRRIPGRQAYEWGVATDCVADGERSRPAAGILAGNDAIDPRHSERAGDIHGQDLGMGMRRAQDRRMQCVRPNREIVAKAPRPRNRSASSKRRTARPV